MWTPAARAQLARGSQPYATCLTDAEWALVEPFLPSPAKTGRPRSWPMRRVVDAILYNRAPFAQPFPLLEIRFADLNGKLLASRSFKPSEYLSGELAGQTIMPPQVPIHIALDILDPGAKAVNYSLGFHSPD